MYERESSEKTNGEKKAGKGDDKARKGGRKEEVAMGE